MEATAVAPTEAIASKRWSLWIGRVLSAIPVLMLLLSASLKFAHPASATDMFVNQLGYHLETLLPLGILEVACVLVYLVPQTAVLGAILVTGYLGGAIATHVRVGQAFAIPLLLGVSAWVGLYLRDARMQALIPLRSKPQPS
jgi:hypothetical protein